MGRFREMSSYGRDHHDGKEVEFADGVPVCIFANQGGGATADHNTVNQIHIPTMPVTINLTIQSLVIGSSVVQPLPALQPQQPMGFIDVVKRFLGITPAVAPVVDIQGSLPQIQAQLQEAIKEQVGKALIETTRKDGAHVIQSRP